MGLFLFYDFFKEFIKNYYNLYFLAYDFGIRINTSML